MSVLSEIYSRASWGARHRAGFANISANQPFAACWTHHSVTAHLSPNATVAQEKAQMRILEDIGQQRFNGGISYTYVIFPSGRIYMGTGASRRGAHTGGHNSTSIAVCFAGNYENNRPTAASERAYARLLQGLRSAGVLRQARTNGGHKDAPGNAWNACPGRHLHARIGAINRLAAGNLSAPSPTPTSPVLEGEVMSASDVWGHRGLDYVNDNASTKNAQLARAHQYGLNVWNRIRSNDWADWLAGRVLNLRNGESGVSHSRHIRRGDFRYRGIDYVNENPSTKDAQLARAHQYAMQASQRAREANDKIDAVADAMAELVGQIDANTRKALEDRLAAIKTESARVSAEEVAAELEVTVREQNEEEDDS